MISAEEFSPCNRPKRKQAFGLLILRERRLVTYLFDQVPLEEVQFTVNIIGSFIQPSSFFLVGLVEIIICLSGVKVHIAVLGAEFDHLSPPALLKQFEEVLTAKSEVGRLNIFSFILFYFILSIFGCPFVYACLRCSYLTLHASWFGGYIRTPFMMCTLQHYKIFFDTTWLLIFNIYSFHYIYSFDFPCYMQIDHRPQLHKSLHYLSI